MIKRLIARFGIWLVKLSGERAIAGAGRIHIHTISPAHRVLVLTDGPVAMQAAIRMVNALESWLDGSSRVCVLDQSIRDLIIVKYEEL